MSRPKYKPGRLATDYEGGKGWCPWEECGELIKEGDDAQAHYAAHQAASEPVSKSSKTLKVQKDKLEKEVAALRAEIAEFRKAQKAEEAREERRKESEYIVRREGQ